MDLGLFFTIIACFVTIIGLGYNYLINFKSEMIISFEKISQKFDKIDQRFEKMDEKFNLRFDKIDEKFEKLLGEIKEIRTGMNRLEGAIYSKDCCMLKDEKISKKAK